MRKLFYIAALATLPLAASAQSITITGSDAPQTGESWTELMDNRYGMHQIGAGGAAQTWDYSNAFEVDDTVVTNFVSVASVPASYSANFPNATIASYNPGDSMAVFFKQDATGFYVDGMGTDPVVVEGITVSHFPFEPDMLVVPGPFTYGDTRSNTGKMIIEGSVGIAQFRMVITTYQSFVADGYGSLTTPAGTYPNTLRVREFSYSIDSTYTNFGAGWSPIPGSSYSDTTITYTWYKNGPGARLMTLQEDAFNPGTSIAAGYQSSVMVSAPEQIAVTPASNVYPNPVVNKPVTFDIENANATRLVITDMLGRQVKTENVAGLNRLVLATNQFGAGTYMYSLLDKNGNRIDNGRFVILK